MAKALENFACLLFVQSSSNSFFATFASQRISDVSAQNRPGSSHERIVRPQIAMMRRQPEGEYVHAASQRDHRIVGDADQHEPRPTQAHYPRTPEPSQNS